MRIDPNMQRSFSGESMESSPRTQVQLRQAAAIIKRELFRVHAQWLATGDQKTLMRQQQLSMALERTLYRLHKD